MTSKYTAPEVVEIGQACEVILGCKCGGPLDVDLIRDASDYDLDE